MIQDDQDPPFFCPSMFPLSGPWARHAHRQGGAIPHCSYLASLSPATLNRAAPRRFR